MCILINQIIQSINTIIHITAESKHKNISAKGYSANWSEECFVIKKLKNTVPLTYVINGLNGKDIVGMFYEKELQKTYEKEFRIEKVTKRKLAKSKC